MSNESDIGAQQNVLDLRIARVELNSQIVQDILGNRNVTESTI